MFKSWFSKCIRFFTGWKDIQGKEYCQEDAIVIFPHTSYWDILIAFLFLDKQYSRNSRFIILPQVFNFLTDKLLRYLQFLPAPSLEKKNSNTVEKFCEMFNDIRNHKKDDIPVCFFLSPKGTIKKKDWRTGYYHIAKTLNVPIYVMNQNWALREVTFEKVIPIVNQPEEETRQMLYDYIGKTNVPLNICNSEIPLVDVPAEYLDIYWNSILPFDICTVSMFVFLPSMLLCLINGFYVHFFCLVNNFCISILYHHNNETKLTKHDKKIVNLDYFFSLTTFIFFVSTAQHISYFFIFLLGLSLLFYIAGIPRDDHILRNRYCIFHSMFHLIAGFASFEISRNL